LKRSEYIAIGAVGLLAAATLWPSNQQPLPPTDPALGKGDGFQTLAFASLAECKDSQAVTASTCETEYGKASQTSLADAPKFEALKDCETEYGASQCRPASWNGASVFIPAMAGVLIARSLAGGAATSQPLYPPRTGPLSCPAGVSLAERPECAPRSSSGSSSSSSSGGGSSSRSYYSTGSGSTISRVGGSVVADTVLPPRTSVSRSTVSRTGSSTSGWSGSSSSSTSYSRSSTTGVPSSSSTSSRGGFGSTASAHSSGSS
jgi:uncharacterized protein YgiB involved in biofilm formation